MNKKASGAWIVALMVFWGLPAILHGQAAGSAISGVVRDATQAVVARATVSVTNVETGITRTRETDAGGLQ